MRPRTDPAREAGEREAAARTADVDLAGRPRRAFGEIDIRLTGHSGQAGADLAEELRQAIGRFVRTTRAHADTLPAAQAETLGHLDRDGAQTIAELANRRGVKHQSMSRTVGELEALAFVSRAPNPADGRGFVITLTDGGAEALATDRASRRDWVADAIATRLTPDEQRLLTAVPDLLNRLSAPAESHP
ncbi:MarR family transcriptional regulator [Actinoplanes sp. NPDC051851]|uniref:MarR family winged helix-turn-helix transcriptional regulator n=1 Tax=Actinoplanes sp. NPDC051851 TaxID=3154753 RepID=UPI00341A39B2